jgi:hypothetical protein
MVLIERGDTHEIRNTGRGLLKALRQPIPLKVMSCRLE